MSRYIDADELINDLLKSTPIDWHNYIVDVQEVRHGRWVDRWFCSNYSGYDYGMNCSVCGKPTHRQLVEKMPPYCPNCGAKMEVK